MPSTGDPYRTLGLPPGAPLGEIKRAYRRLAKENHPDTAGEAAIPRFLAIRAAYDELTGGPNVRRRSAPPQRQPWEADPDRARATRGAWRSRAGRSPGSGHGAGTGTEPGGADARAGGGAPRRPGSEGHAGNGPRSTAAEPGAPRAGEAGPGAPGGGPGASRAGSRAGSARHGSRRGPDRPPDRATPGSTSYDFAEHEPFDPEWTGASWYGQSSGTYWTINPREYADPRKHGPEYQARARRGAPGAHTDGMVDVEWETVTPDPGPSVGETTAGTATGAARAEPAPPAADAGRASRPGARGTPSSDDRVDPGASTGTAAADIGAPWVRSPRFGARHPSPPPAPAATAAGGEDDPLAVLPLPPRLRSRFARALLGWPPIGLGLALVIGELTGCGRFSATCVETFALGTWVAQVFVLGLLVAVPALAAIAAVGSLSFLAAAVPAAVLLSAVGGSRDPAAAGSALAVVLAVAWAGGVALAVARRSRTVTT